jgi:hypothetical protein
MEDHFGEYYGMNTDLKEVGQEDVDKINIGKDTKK